MLSYTHDCWGRVINVISSDGTINYQYLYDKLHRNYKVVDLLTNRSSEKIFDSNGNALEERLANGLVVKATYDTLDRMVTLTIPDGRSAEFYFEGANLKKAYFNGKQIHFNSYDLKGLLLTQTLPCGPVSYEYDLKGRLISKEDPLHAWKMTYDPNGNLISKFWKDLLGKGTNTYVYDSLDQLIQEYGIFKSIYESDSLYNRRQANGTSYTINDLNEIESVGNDRYTWDLNGNPQSIEKGGEETQYHFDAFDRLIEVEMADKSIHYIYDGWHRRLERVEETSHDNMNFLISHQRFLYFKDIEFGTYDDNHLTELKIFADTKTDDIGSTLLIELEGTLWLPLSSNHGDIVALISPDEKGFILETYRYNAFGEYVMTLSSSQYYYGQNPWRFQSKRLDLETNWVHFGSRDYSPELGRWMTPDPAGFVDSVNLYQYLYNNPHKYVDPKGKFIFLIAPLFTLSFGVGAATLVLPTVTVLAQVAASAVIAYGTYELINAVNDQRILNQLADPDTLLEQEKKQGPRTEPNSLEEQLALEEAKGSQNEDKEIMKGKIGDPRYPTEEWAKKQHLHEALDGSEINIHYWENRLTGETHGYKFKDD